MAKLFDTQLNLCVSLKMHLGLRFYLRISKVTNNKTLPEVPDSEVNIMISVQII